MKNSTWTVVTIQEEDGHEFDGIFITNNENEVEEFADKLNPLLVCCSRYATENEAKDFFFEICDGYMNIDPKYFTKPNLPGNVCAVNPV